jgi:hypothetical protein
VDATRSPDPKALRARLREDLTRLAGEVDAKRRDAGFLEALRTMATFWRYSPFNQFLIRMQRRDASRVAGRLAWERLGRHPKPGERPAHVLAPTRSRFGFVEVPVYDVRQTRGRRLRTIETMPRGRSRHVTTLLGAASRLGIAVAFEPQPGGCAARSLGGRIEVSPALPGAAKVRGLAHELAHEVLHQAERERAAARKRPPPARTHAEEETEADATAWVVLRVLGIDPPSPAYIAWQGGDGAAVLRSMSRIQRAARRILEAAERAGAAPRARGRGPRVRESPPPREG